MMEEQKAPVQVIPQGTGQPFDSENGTQPNQVGAVAESAAATVTSTVTADGVDVDFVMPADGTASKSDAAGDRDPSVNGVDDPAEGLVAEENHESEIAHGPEPSVRALRPGMTAGLRIGLL